MTTPDDLAAFNSGVARARAEYNPDAERASFEYGNPQRTQPRRTFPPHVKAAAVEAYLAGESQRSIADRLETSQPTVSSWVVAARKAGEGA